MQLITLTEIANLHNAVLFPYQVEELSCNKHGMALEEAVDYAKDHLDEIPCGELEYISDSDELDEENCDFEE